MAVSPLAEATSPSPTPKVQNPGSGDFGEEIIFDLVQAWFIVNGTMVCVSFLILLFFLQIILTCIRRHCVGREDKRLAKQALAMSEKEKTDREGFKAGNGVPLPLKLPRPSFTSWFGSDGGSPSSSSKSRRRSFSGTTTRTKERLAEKETKNAFEEDAVSFSDGIPKEKNHPSGFRQRFKGLFNAKASSSGITSSSSFDSLKELQQRHSFESVDEVNGNVINNINGPSTAKEKRSNGLKQKQKISSTSSATTSIEAPFGYGWQWKTPSSWLKNGKSEPSPESADTKIFVVDGSFDSENNAIQEKSQQEPLSPQYIQFQSTDNVFPY